MSRLRIGLVKDAVVGLTAVIPFEHLAMAGGVNIPLAQSTMRFISQTTRSLRTLDAESARFVTHAFEAYGGADQRDESIRRDAGHAHVLFEPEPFHADVAITLAAFSMGVCRHFDCANFGRGEASQIKLLAAPACRTGAVKLEAQKGNSSTQSSLGNASSETREGLMAMLAGIDFIDRNLLTPE